MIPEFVQAFDKQRKMLAKQFREYQPREYIDIVRAVVDAIQQVLVMPEEVDTVRQWLTAKRIVEAQTGSYQGDSVYLIPSTLYSECFYVWVEYGSCSSCDTLQGIHDLGDSTADPATDKQVEEYMSLALHVVQSIKRLPGRGEKSEK